MTDGFSIFSAGPLSSPISATHLAVPCRGVEARISPLDLHPRRGAPPPLLQAGQQLWHYLSVSRDGGGTGAISECVAGADIGNEPGRSMVFAAAPTSEQLPARSGRGGVPAARTTAAKTTTTTTVGRPSPSAPTALDMKLGAAVKMGSFERVREALTAAGAGAGAVSPNPNAVFKDGSTPLTLACRYNSRNEAGIVRLLLEAGADPSLSECSLGFTPLHVAAVCNKTSLVDLLAAAAPATLNHYANRGETPLCLACAEGHESMVLRLLLAGARQKIPPDPRGFCPLGAALKGGHDAVVRLLLDTDTDNSHGTRGLGLAAVGGSIMIPNSMYGAVRFGRVAGLRLLLAVAEQCNNNDDDDDDDNNNNNPDEEGELAMMLRAPFAENRRLLHFAAGYYRGAAVTLLLSAGASETLADARGRLPRDVIGMDARAEGRPRDKGKEAAIGRMLDRAAAYRARSWAWPAMKECSGAGGGAGGGGLSSARALVLSSRSEAKAKAKSRSRSRSEAKRRPVVGVRVLRDTLDPKEFVGSAIHRYCQKKSSL